MAQNSPPSSGSMFAQLSGEIIFYPFTKLPSVQHSSEDSWRIFSTKVRKQNDRDWEDLVQEPGSLPRKSRRVLQDDSEGFRWAVMAGSPVGMGGRAIRGCGHGGWLKPSSPWRGLCASIRAAKKTLQCLDVRHYFLLKGVNRLLDKHNLCDLLPKRQGQKKYKPIFLMNICA